MSEIQYKICPNCQMKTRLTAQFCEGCGRKFRTQFTQESAPAEQTGVFTTTSTAPFLAERSGAAQTKPGSSRAATPPETARFGEKTEPTAPPRMASPFGNMATMGLRFIGVGLLILAYFFFFFDTRFSPTSRLPNMEKMQQQTMGFVAGFGVAVIGAVFTAAGYIKGEPIEWRAVLSGNGRNANPMYVVGGSVIVVLVGIIIFLLQRSPRATEPGFGTTQSDRSRTAPYAVPTPFSMPRR